MKVALFDDTLWRVMQSAKLAQFLRQAAWIFVGVVALCLSGQLSLPLAPVPLTFQTLVVLWLGLTYDRTMVLATLFGFLTLGLMGAPVFAQGQGGAAYFFGPTGGYLGGLAVAAFFMASLRERFQITNFLGLLALAMLGALTVLLMGMLWLSRFVGVDVAFQVGVKLFLFLEAFKVLFVAYVCRLVQELRQAS
ncbi:MAG: biotin transporter BioY [Holosporaceae bacterium]